MTFLKKYLNVCLVNNHNKLLKKILSKHNGSWTWIPSPLTQPCELTLTGPHFFRRMVAPSLWHFSSNAAFSSFRYFHNSEYKFNDKIEL